MVAAGLVGLPDSPFIESGAGKRANKILLNTMPKSGSVYIAKSLAKILDCKLMYLGDPFADRIELDRALTFSDGGYISQNHLAPSDDNLQILRRLELPMVLHLRDPRQALLSWVYHLEWKHRTEGFLMKEEPPDYLELPLSGQIDWQIDHHLVRYIWWMERWVEIADRGTIPILITHHNDLRCNERAFFDAILAFYHIRHDYELPNLPRTLNDTHFRKADPEEWKRTFTSEQAARATSAIPAVLQSRFGWN